MGWNRLETAGACRRIVHEHDHALRPVVVLLNFPQVEDIERIMAAGAAVMAVSSWRASDSKVLDLNNPGDDDRSNAPTP